MGCAGIGKAVTVCNIAVFNAVYTFWKMNRLVWENKLQIQALTGNRFLGDYKDPDAETRCLKSLLEGQWERQWEWRWWVRHSAKSMEAFDFITFDICRDFPTGFYCLFGKDGFVRDRLLCVSPEKKWVVQGNPFHKIRLLQTGIEQQHVLCRKTCSHRRCVLYLYK